MTTTKYKFTDDTDSVLRIGNAARRDRTAILGGSFVYIPADEAPTTMRAIAAASDADAVVVEGVGPLPEVTEVTRIMKRHPEGQNSLAVNIDGVSFSVCDDTSDKHLRARMAAYIAILAFRGAEAREAERPLIDKIMEEVTEYGIVSSQWARSGKTDNADLCAASTVLRANLTALLDSTDTTRETR